MVLHVRRSMEDAEFACILRHIAGVKHHAVIHLWTWTFPCRTQSLLAVQGSFQGLAQIVLVRHFACILDLRSWHPRETGASSPTWRWLDRTSQSHSRYEDEQCQSSRCNQDDQLRRDLGPLGALGSTFGDDSTKHATIQNATRMLALGACPAR